MPYQTPQALVAGLKARAPQARLALEARYAQAVGRQARDTVERFGIQSNPAVLAARQLRVLECWLCFRAESMPADLSWSEFDASVLSRSQGWLSFLAPRANLPGKTSNERPLRGIRRAGRFSIRWFCQPMDEVSGDLFEYQLNLDGSLTLFVGDVTGHGPAAALLTQGLPYLFRSCLARQMRPGQLAALRDAMDQALAGVLPEGCLVQGVLAHVALSPPGFSQGGYLGITPDAALMATNSTAERTHDLAITTHLFGLDWAGAGVASESIGVHTAPFTDRHELLVATDGVLDQPSAKADDAPALRSSLVQDLPSLQPDLSLLDQVLRRLQTAIKDYGAALDDALLVSIRQTTPEEELVFDACDGGFNAQQRFFEQFRPLVWKLTHAILGTTAFARSDGELEFDDVVQDVFLHLFRKLPLWSGGLLKAWVQRTATNFLLSVGRKRSRQARGLPGLMQPLTEIAGHQLEPHEEALMAECLERVVQGLDPRDRQLLAMLQQGSNREEICTRLKLSKRSYYHTLQQVEERLRACIAGSALRGGSRL